MKKIIQTNGTSLVVGLIGSPDDILGEFNALWNHGATRGELNWGHQQYAYFWTSKQRLERAMLSRAIGVFLKEDTSKYKGKKGGFINEARILAELNLKEFKLERCLYIWNAEDIYHNNFRDYQSISAQDDHYESGNGLYKPAIKL